MKNLTAALLLAGVAFMSLSNAGANTPSEPTQTQTSTHQ